MKRFTETCKWSKEWYQELDPINKCLWQYLCDNCDSAGVWETNWKLASFQIGAPVKADNLASFGSRISCLSDGKIMIVSFVDFQYGTLSKECPAHKPVFKTIQKHSLQYPINTLTLGYQKASDSLQEKEKEKEEVQEKEWKGTGEGVVNRRFKEPERSEVSFQAEKMGLPQSEVDKFMAYYGSNGWKVGKNPMKSWICAMTTWKVNFEERKFMNGGSSGSLFPRTQADIDKQIEAIQFQIQEIKENGHVMDGNLITDDLTPEAQAKVRSAYEKISELRKQKAGLP